MFKLESYITPLLLNYVDKYIKNLKPEDSQFSLWGGDAVFCNLDLRLDVLEQELQLPFSFVNGHIHELRIHVPWTKLGSEPVVITINTIECILKLCNDNDSSDTDCQKSHNSRKPSVERTVRKSDVLEAPPGYIQSLINRVISNICIVCNNLILKYVEDDIVLSLNIKSVELFNAGENWDRAYVDTNLTDVVSRKVITMQDLTVCLDKRDASGKIETYQDPLLYRCSTTWRVYSLYNSPHSKYPSLTRIHMYCESLDFSLTDQQLPMFLRLLNLCLYLHSRSSSSNYENKIEDSCERNVEEDLDSTDVISDEESWGSWAWSFVPDVGLILGSSDSEEQEKEANMLKLKKIFQFGIYIGKTSCVLKHTIVSSSKYLFSPSMILNLYGCCMEFTSRGKDFINIQTGICGATVAGYNECVCGFQDISSNTPEMKNIFLKSGVPPGGGHEYSFLSSSLFDPLAPENCDKERQYCFNREEHLSMLTEEVLVQRFPAFALDYLYELQVPDEWMDRISNVTSSFLEESNWHETSTCRLVLGPLCVDVTSSLIHRLTKLFHCAKDYEYPCYIYFRKSSVPLTAISEDIIEQMEEFVPVRQYHLTIFKPAIHLFIASHSPYSATLKSDLKKSKRRNIKHFKNTRQPKVSENLFCLELYADCVDLQAISPMYPNRLIKIVESLQNPSHSLLHHCYNLYSGKLFGFEVSLFSENSSLSAGYTIIQQTCLTISMKSLSLPDSWNSFNHLILNEYTFECSSIHLKFSEIKLLALIGIYQSWTVKQFNPISLEKLQLDFDKFENGFPCVKAEILDIKCLCLLRKDLTLLKCSIYSVSLKFQTQDLTSILFRAPESTLKAYEGICSTQIEKTSFFTQGSKHEVFFQLLVQIPKEVASQNTPLICVLHVSGSTACFEPALFSWLGCDFFSKLNLNTDLENTSASSVDFEDASPCSSITQEASASISVSKSQSTVLDTEKSGSFQKYLENFLLQHSDFLCNLILEVEIGCLCALGPKSEWSVIQKDDVPILLLWQETISKGLLNGACVFCFPKIKLKNNNSFSSTLQNMNFESVISPIMNFQYDKKSQDFFPWTLEMNNWTIYSIQKDENIKEETVLLWPLTISATIALSLKSIQNQLALCIHMDCKVLHINISTFQTELFAQCFKTLFTILNFVDKMNSWISSFHLTSIAVPEYEIKPKTASPSKKTSYDGAKSSDILKNEHSKKLTLWAQFTLSKLNVIFLTKLSKMNDYTNFKLQFSAEEIVSSLDIQEIYSKIKMKMSSLNIHCFKRQLKEYDWQSGPYDGVVFFCNSILPKTMRSRAFTENTNIGQHAHVKQDTQPFLTLTYTQALHSNASEKWTIDQKQNFPVMLEGLQFISEIDVKLNSFGLVLWMSLFDTLQQCVVPYVEDYTKSSGIAKESASEDITGIEFCSRNLPLLYIETKIMQLYIPDNNILLSECTEKMEKSFLYNSETEVLLLQLDSVALTSQVENPLPRIILDSEIYTSALNSKTIGLPGSPVEDRQYQIDINGLAVGSISGINILHHNEIKRDFSTHCPIIMGENPALEWNIGAVPDNRNLSDDSYMITAIVAPLNIKIAVAPAIVCHSNSNISNIERIIVAGISFEISVANEVNLYLSIHQMCLIYTVLKNNLNFLIEIFNKHKLGIKTSSVEIIENESTHLERHQATKDILQSPICSPKSHDSTFNEFPIYNFVPFEILVTAGTISIMFFYHDDLENFKSGASVSPVKSLVSPNTMYCEPSAYSSNFQSHGIFFKQKVVSSDESSSISCSNLSKKASKSVQLHPFLCLCIIQPHCYLLCHTSSQKFESSCFDLQLCGSPAGFTVEKPYVSTTPVNSDFIFSYLETKPGELHKKTGIPPALLTMTCLDIFNNPTDMTISVERPVKLHIKSCMWKAPFAFIECFQRELLKFNELPTEKSDSSSPTKENDSPQNVAIITFFKKIAISTTQMAIEIIPSINDDSEKILFSMCHFEVECDFESYKDDAQSCELMMTISSLNMQTCSCDQIWNHLQPVSFTSAMKFHLKPCAQIEVSLVGESLLLNLSLRHMLVLKRLINSLIEQIQELENCDKKSDSMEAECDDNSFNTGRKRVHWTDDLRKGAFQFIQVNDSQDYNPKSHEIVFCRASSNQPASMTWCYPEPRALTKIEVSPVPFQNDSEEPIESNQILTCYLQYWNSTHHEYIYLCEFVLSETEHITLNLPDLNLDCIAVSNKWRVLLDSGGRYLNEDGNFEKENPHLSPLALAACLSINSCFDINLVSPFQMKASFELLKITFYNHFEKTGCSPTFYPFQFDDESPLNQEFGIISLMSPVLSYVKWATKVKAELSSGFTCDILEYRNLTMIPLISPVDMSSNLSVKFDKEKDFIVDWEFLLHPCFVRLSQSVFHTLTYTKHSLLQQISLTSSTSVCSEYVLPNYFIICNNLEERIRFGQAGTEENILLSPLKMHAYSWCCHKSKQALWISAKSLFWKWSKDFSIDKEGTFLVHFGNKTGVIVRIKKLSNLQKQVIIDGQLIVHSQLNFPIQFKFELSDSTAENITNCNVVSVKSLAPNCNSPAFILSVEQCKKFHLSFTSILDSQFWSETVKLNDHKIIKVPWMSYGQYQYVLCHIVEQKLPYDPEFSTFIVFITPLIILRSSFPFPLNVTFTTHSGETSYELLGKGREITCFATSDISEKIHISFSSGNDLKLSAPPLSISLSELTEMSITPFEKNANFHDLHYNMQSFHYKHWPYSFFERMQNTSEVIDSVYPCSESPSCITPAVPSTLCCPIKVEKCQRWSGLKTVLFHIKPDVILVNRLQDILYLNSDQGLEWTLPSSSVAVITQPYEKFQLSVVIDGVHWFSPSLTVERSVLTKASNKVQSEKLTFSTSCSQSIPAVGSVNLIIRVQSNSEMFYLLKLVSEIHEDIVVITAFPVVNVVNKSAVELYFSSSCASSNEENVKIDCPGHISAPLESTSDVCHPMLLWKIFSKISSTAENINLHLYLSISKFCMMWSNPIYLNSKFCGDNRYSLSLPIKFDEHMTTLPFVLTSHWRKGILFLLLNDDPCPLFLLHNRTSLNLYYGQSCTPTDGKYVLEELENFDSVPMLQPMSSAHYCFPSVQKSFPHLPEVTPMLCLGLKENSDESYLWSIPFRVSVEKQFVHILGICDFMIQTERIAHTINLYIDIVNRIEVTANEVRSRIAIATNSNHNYTKEGAIKSKVLDNKINIDVQSNKLPFSAINTKDSSHTNFQSTYYLNLRIIHISVLICDEFVELNKSIEILRINVDNAMLFSRPQNLNSGNTLQDICICFGDIQVDNQVNNEDSTVCDFPVILHRRTQLKDQISLNKESEISLPNKIRENAMFILNGVIELIGGRINSIIFTSCDVNLRPISLYVEDTFYYRFLELIKTYEPANFHQHVPQWCDIYVPKEVQLVSAVFTYPFHFQKFKINIPEISLSLHASLKIYLSLEHSLLRFQPFEKEDLFTTHYEAGRILMLHYMTGALFRAGWVVGSLDILGNPANFARAVGAGVTDFVYLPYKGLLHGPRAFVSGLTMGAMSLFTQISSGALTCMASLAASISKNMDYLCLDEEHLARHELVRHHLPQGISEGLAQGLSVFGLSLLSAVAGIIDHPLQVLVSPSTPLKTASGVVSGFGKGIVGIFTKPIGGAAELLSQTGYGLLHGAGWLIPPKRQYQPISVSFEMTPSSFVKYASKVALCQSLGEVLLSTESTYVNENGEYEKNILLLTTEALCILADDEFTLLRTFALTEIRCKKAESDRSTLIVIPSCAFHKKESQDVLDRVVDYLKKNRMDVSSNFDNFFFYQDNIPESLIKSSSSCYIFFLYPKDRSLFLTLFNYAKNKALRKGF